MKLSICALLTLTIFVGAEPQGSKWPKVLLIGDSITQGSYTPDAPWSALLSQHLIRRADVINRGLNGYTTRGYKKVFDIAVDGIKAQSIGAVLIFLGANDAAHEGQYSHVPLKEYEDNLKDLVEMLRKIGVSKERVVISSPPPVYGRNDRDPTPYVQAARSVADSLQISFLNAHGHIGSQKNPEKLFRDGLHFNSEGADVFFNLIRSTVEKKLQEYKGVDHLPDNFPNP
jgi:lysophospholipase L1-like esterase